MKTIKNQKIKVENKTENISISKNYKIAVPFLLLTLIIIFSFNVSDVAAAQGTNYNTPVKLNLESTSTIIGVNNQKPTSTANTINSNSISNSKTIQNSPDPRIYKNGDPVDRGHGIDYPYPTIAAAIADAQSGDTIMLESGQTFYESGFYITKNLDFNVLNNGFATIDAQKSNQIFHVYSGVTVNLQNIVLKNGNAGYGSAIENYGTMNIKNCNFTGNSASASGGVIYNSGTVNINNCSFTGNSAAWGGAVWSEGTAAIDGCNFQGNTASSNGGAIRNWGTMTVKFSRIVGNTAPDADLSNTYYGTTTAINNWWGSNSNPSGRISVESGFVTYNPWIILTIRSNHINVSNGGTSTLTADLCHDSTYNPANPDASYLDPANGHVPDGIPIAFNTAWGTITDSSLTTKDGSVTATFNANGPGYTPSTDVYASADNEQNTFTTINIQKKTTITIANYAHGTRGHTVDLTAHVFDVDTNNVNEGQVRFNVGSASPVVANVHNGYATYSGWPIPSDWDIKQYTITATYLGTDYYDTSSGQSFLIVEPKTTTTKVDPARGTRGHTVDLVAKVVDSDDSLVDEGQVMFTVGSAPPVMADVHGGVATYKNWLIPSNWASVRYNLEAIYMGTTNYLSSADENSLVVDPKTTTTTVDPAHNFAGHLVNLTAHVVDSDGNPVNEGLVQFNNGFIAAIVHNGVASFTNWMIPNKWKTGNYDIVATFLGTTNYKISTNKNTLTVDPTPTTIKMNDVSGNKGETVNLTALLEDGTNHHFLGDKTVKFYVNGTFVGASVTNYAGIALLPYKITENHGYYYIDAVFGGDDIFNGSSGGANLDVHQSNLYVTVKTSNSHPNIGEKIYLIFKVGNRGPDTANNVVFTFKVPDGMQFIGVNVDNGSYTYNAESRTVTWTIGDVPVGDPKLVMGLKVLKAGNYTIKPGLSTSTYDPNLAINIGNVNVNVSNGNSSKPVVHGQTVPMQPTGTPVLPLLLGVLITIAGLVTTRKN